MYTVRFPALLRKSIPDAWCRMPSVQKELFLTFDDGPTPEVTPWVLEILDQFQAKATFFVLGKQVAAHEEIYRDTIARGHTVGNHSYAHPDGWHTSKEDYLSDIAKCATLVNSRLFRPPYGRIGPAQYAALKKDYTVVMWDVLSGDFDPDLAPEKCLNGLLKYSRAGSIAVFHDSRKAFPLLKEVLFLYIKAMQEDGYVFKALPEQQPG